MRLDPRNARNSRTPPHGPPRASGASESGVVAALCRRTPNAPQPHFHSFRITLPSKAARRYSAAFSAKFGMNRETLIGKLKDDIAQGRVVIVAGTGVSIAACGNQKVENYQVASWAGLLQHGLAYCRTLGIVMSLPRRIGWVLPVVPP
jgi:hypothetical protein